MLLILSTFLLEILLYTGLDHAIPEVHVILALLLQPLHVFLIIIENILPTITGIKRLNVQIVLIDGFLSLKFVKFQVEGFSFVLELVQFDHVVEEDSHKLLLLLC